MAYFKIKNNTNNLGKRHPRFNTIQNIEYKDLLKSTSTSINPGAEIFIEGSHLPISAHKLRAEGFITVTEIDKNTYQKLNNANNAEIALQEASVVELVPVKESADSESYKNSKFKKKLN